MKNLTYHFEIQDMLIQFVAAFDDVVIGRFNKNREEKEQIKVRYIHAPKQRVLHDIVNKAQNITLPVIAVNATSISRDTDRVFNKLDGFVFPPNKKNNGWIESVDIPMPLPIDISVSMSILGSFQSDVEQIISNFAPYCNPYVVISWRVPDAFGLQQVTEIRSTVIWDGNVTLEYPTDLDPNVKTRFIANTTFTIKGWLFQAAPADRIENIYFVDSNFRVSSKLELDRDNYSQFVSEQYQYDPTKNLLNETETVSISAVPKITNILTSTLDEISGTKIVYSYNDKEPFVVYGENLDLVRYVMLSSTSNKIVTTYPAKGYNFIVDEIAEKNYTFEDPNEDYPGFDMDPDDMISRGLSAYYPPVTASIIPVSNFQIINKNILKLNIPLLTKQEDFVIIFANDIGWVKSSDIDVKFFSDIITNRPYETVYFYGTTLVSGRYNWGALSNWYSNESHTTQLTRLPRPINSPDDKLTYVKVLSTRNVHINLDNPTYFNVEKMFLYSSTVTVSSTTNKNFAVQVVLDADSQLIISGNATNNI